MTRWSPSRRAVLDSLADELLHNYGRGRTIVAVDGPTAAGKSTFADDLAEAHPQEGARRLPRLDRRLPEAARRALRAGPRLGEGPLRGRLRLLGVPPRADRAVRHERQHRVRDRRLGRAPRPPDRAEVAERPGRRDADRRRQLPEPPRTARAVERLDLAGRGRRGARPAHARPRRHRARIERAPSATRARSPSTRRPSRATRRRSSSTTPIPPRRDGCSPTPNC